MSMLVTTLFLLLLINWLMIERDEQNTRWNSDMQTRLGNSRLNLKQFFTVSCKQYYRSYGMLTPSRKHFIEPFPMTLPRLPWTFRWSRTFFIAFNYVPTVWNEVTNFKFCKRVDFGRYYFKMKKTLLSRRNCASLNCFAWQLQCTYIICAKQLMLNCDGDVYTTTTKTESYNQESWCKSMWQNEVFMCCGLDDKQMRLIV